MRRFALLCILLFPACMSGQGPGESYVSCRCCCHESNRDLPLICLYHGTGDSMADIIRKDDEWRQTPAGTCQPNAGCMQKTLYKYCDETPPALE